MQLIKYKDETFTLIENGKLSFLEQDNIFLHLIPHIQYFYYPSLYYIKDDQFYFINMHSMDFEEIPEYWREYQEYLYKTRNMIPYLEFLDLHL